MKRVLLVFTAVAFFMVTGNVCGGTVPRLFADPGTVDLGTCAPGDSCERSFRLVIRDTHPRWAVFVKAEGKKESEKVISCLLLEGPGVKLEKISTEAQKFLEGTGSGDIILEVKLRAVPNWTVSPGTYSLRLLFQYLPDTGNPEEPPLPLPVTITVPPQAKLTMEGEGTLRFAAEGSPGRYPLEGSITLRGIANTESWKTVLRAESLRGEKGGTIPPSRIFKKNNKEYVPLDKGLEIGPFPGGEEIEIVLNEFYVETTLEDPPDTYEGELRFQCFLKE